MKKQDQGKTPVRPLAIARERVRALDPRELAQVAGGGWYATPSGS